MNVLFQFLKLSVFIIVFFIFTDAKAEVKTELGEYEQLLQEAIKNKDFGKASYYSYELAKFYFEADLTDKAIEYLTQSILYSKKAGDQTLTLLAYQKLGIVYTQNNNHSKALDHFQKALKIAKELKKPEFVNEGLLNVATTYAQLSKYKKSIEPLEEALSLALQQNNLPLQQRCYELLAAYYQEIGNKSKAVEYGNLFTNLMKSQQFKEQSAEQLKLLENQINNVSEEKNAVNSKLKNQSQKLRKAEDSLLTTKYSLEETENSLIQTSNSLKEVIEINEHRQLQIELLNSEKQLAEVRIKEQNARIEYEAWIRNLVIGGIFLSSAFVVVVVFGYKKKVADNKKIEQQNKNIKSSINYAKRIQEAMLPNAEQQSNLIPNSFILFKPKDAVSGDFYWINELKSWYNPDVIFAAADCTGHGIPGAFMSMVGINSLNGIVNRGIAEPNEILDALDVEIRTSLQQETTRNNDGMDIALCIFRTEKNILEFSGAKNPLVYIKNNELHQVKGDVQSIGGSNSKNILPFKKYSVSIDQPTMIYLFSDGYKDQFGQNNTRKFMSKQFNKLLFEIHHLPLQEQKEILDKTIEEWKGECLQTDDILVMGVRLEPKD